MKSLNLELKQGYNKIYYLQPGMHGADLVQETLLHQVAGQYDSEKKYKNNQHLLGTGCLFSKPTLHIDRKCRDLRISFV